MSDVTPGLATLGTGPYAPEPIAAAKVRELIRAYRKDEADEAMLLDCIGIAPEAGNPPA